MPAVSKPAIAKALLWRRLGAGMTDLGEPISTGGPTLKVFYFLPNVMRLGGSGAAAMGTLRATL